MNFNEQKLYICEKIIDTIGEIVKRLDIDYEGNYNYTGLGNYELISKSNKFNKDNFLVSFEINDRANNHKNLFEWKNLYANDNNLRKLKEKLSNAIHFFENGYSDGIADEDDYLEEEFKEYTRKNNERLLIKFEEEKKKLIKALTEEIFKKDSKEIVKLEKVIDIISNNEFNKKYNLEDLLYFDNSILKEDDKTLFEKFEDYYYLYYLKSKNSDEFEVIGFYSLPFSEEDFEVRVDNVPNDDYYLYFSYDNTKCTKAEKEDSLKILGFYSLDINELEDKENISSIIFSKYDFEEVKKYLENGKSLKNWLIKSLKEIYFFELQSQEFEKWKF